MSSVQREAGHGEKIDWRPWGAEAFDEAREQGKLVLLDIGAGWCHWCHVMDRTTYGDNEVAGFVNEHFIPVRVDRDARPDVDRRYQSAPALIESQAGGWPLTAWLLDDGTPLYRATYLPPRDVGRMIGFLSLSRQILRVRDERNDDVRQAAGQFRQALDSAAVEGAAAELGARQLDALFDQLSGAFDETWGGFYGAPHNPKFPSAGALEFLLAHWRRTGKQRALDMVSTTLRRMAEGGVHDQLGGGFHRYAVDQYWRVPHFEKLLYDNAELLALYLHAWQATGEPLFRGTAEGIIRFVDEVLSDRERGGFFGSQDADVGLDDDGDYFTWTVEEARGVLDREEFAVFAAVFDLAEQGEMAHDPSRNVLWRAMTPERAARRAGVDEARAHELLAAGMAKATAARRGRPTPTVDRTMFVSWNGMMIRSYVLAGQVLGRPDLVAASRRAADRILAEAVDAEGAVAHIVGLEEPRGLLEDQAWTALALADLHAATDEARYREAAERIVAWADAHLWDSESGGWFDGPARGDAVGLLSTREKLVEDTPSSSPSAAMVWALQRLSALNGSTAHGERAGAALDALGGLVGRLGVHGGALALAGEVRLAGPTVVTVAGDEASPLVRAAHEVYVPGKIVRRLDPASESGLAELARLGLSPDVAAAYVCRGSTCLPPVRESAALKACLERRQ